MCHVGGRASHARARVRVRVRVRVRARVRVRVRARVRARVRVRVRARVRARVRVRVRVEVVHRARVVVERDVDEGEIGVHVAELRVDRVRGLAVRERLRVPPLVGAQSAELVVELGRSRADLHGRDEG